MSKKIIAIDFGTSNTYLSLRSGDSVVNELNINVGGSEQHGITTAILYYNQGSSKGNRLFGDDAVNTFGGASEKKIAENGLEYSANFKPDIAVSSEAQAHATNFLAAILQSARNQHLDINPQQCDVVFGVPSEASDKYKSTLKQIACQAGWGEIRLLDEPFGALCSYLDEKSNDAIDKILDENVLVIDFGGGTCDFAILQGGVIKKSWGDMLLGGRLFDDLFYQWLLDESQKTPTPVTDEDIIGANRDFYCRTKQARLLKEKFSNRMVNTKAGAYEELITVSLGRAGTVSFEVSLTWSEFQKRAGCYVPSKSFRDKTPIPKSVSSEGYRKNGPMDLFEWFEIELIKGLHQAEISMSDIDKVLLAGGSSMWPFVQDKCKELFQEKKLVRSINPFAAISTGLAKYTVLKDLAMGKATTLRNDSVRVTEEIMNDLKAPSIFDEQKSTIIATGDNIFNSIFLPILNTFREKGGTVASLKKSVNKLAIDRKSDIDSQYRPIFESLKITIICRIEERLQNWLREHGISRYQFKVDVQDAELSILNYFSPKIDIIVTRLSALLSATIGIAILIVIAWVSTPVTWGMGLILAPFVAAVCAGGDAAVVEYTPLPAILTKYMLSKKGIEKFRNTFLKQFLESFKKDFDEFLQKHESEVRDEINKVVDQTIERFQKVLDIEQKVK